jgi:Ca2+-binding RTX toxin-like protein
MGTRRVLLAGVAVTIAVLLGLSQSASGGVTSLCQFDMRFMSVNDTNQSRGFTVGWDSTKNKLRADTIAGPGAGPKACEDPDPWDYIELNLSNGNDGARLDAFKMTNAYKPVPKAIEGYLNGEEGADELIGHKGYDRILGAGGRDRLLGGNGGDELDAGPGRDFVSAGGGSDGIYVNDGVPGDEVHCGPGSDGVFADEDDAIANDCESILR